MDLLPSQYIQRQVRATPYPHEDAGWIIQNTGPEVALFSSDFPHVEGGRNPIARFERSMDAAGVTEADKQNFYVNNYADLLGPVLARRELV
jgi:predicted TIM-barrel fold metal-dependent hydrolase